VWEGKLKDWIWSLPHDQPRFRHGKWRDVFEDQIKSTPFTVTALANPLFSLPLGEDHIEWTVWLSRKSIWQRFRTLGQVAVLEGDALVVSYFYLLFSSPFSITVAKESNKSRRPWCAAQAHVRGDLPHPFRHSIGVIYRVDDFVWVEEFVLAPLQNCALVRGVQYGI
jgi:hypothetical protein